MKSKRLSREIYIPIMKAVATEDGGMILKGIAASEALDGSQEVSDYDSLKAVFEDWFPIGNVREQHDFTKAVGTAIEWEPNDEQREIGVTVHVTAGAPETIQKIKDKVLKGFSVMGDVVRRFEGGTTKLYWRKLKELSIVDSPDIPNCLFQIAKATKGADMADEKKDIAMLESSLAALAELIGVADDETKTKLNAVVDTLKLVLENEKAEDTGEGGGDKEAPLSKELETAKAKVAELEGQLEKAKADMAECEKSATEKCNKAEAEATEKCAKATGEVDSLKKELETAKKASGDYKALSDKLETVMKAIKEPGTPVTKGEGDSKDSDNPYKELPEHWQTAIKACGGDTAKLQMKMMELATADALANRKGK